MGTFIQSYKPGDILTAKHYNSVVDNVNSLNGYTKAKPRMTGGGGGKSNGDFRFQMLDRSQKNSETGENIPIINFVPGVVDNISPTVTDTSIDTVPPIGLGFNPDTINMVFLKIHITASTATDGDYTYLVNNYTTDTVEILNDISIPADDTLTAESPAGYFYVKIGTVYVDATGKITSIQNDGIRTSLKSHYCPPSNVYFTMI